MEISIKVLEMMTEYNGSGERWAGSDRSNRQHEEDKADKFIDDEIPPPKETLAP